MRVLAIFSNPPDQTPLRLDREDKLLSRLADQFPDTVTLKRLHASEVDDIYELVVDGHFDVVHFSGHGSSEGIYLDRRDLAGSHLIRADQLRSLLATAESPPTVAVVLSCYSNNSVAVLCQIAPFVVSALGEVADESCIQFVRGFYESLFRGIEIKTAFERALHLLTARSLDAQGFRLDRRQLIHRGESKYIESTPDMTHTPILVNLDEVEHKLGHFGMPAEALCHLLERKLKIHYWIFSVPREGCVIPIGRLLFGEFSWHDSKDVVYCTRLMKLSADTPPEHWSVWNTLLVSYNDLASSDYRALPDPASPTNLRALRAAVTNFERHIGRYLEPAKNQLTDLGYADLVPHVEMTASHCRMAEDYLAEQQYPLVVQSLESALTNYHEVVDGLRPPEDEPPSSG